MRKHKFIMAILVITLCSSCDNWLDLEPSDKVDDSKLYSTYEGFRNSLNGIYTSISEGELYGREMTWGLLSVLGQDYLSGSSGTSSTYQYAQQYNYTRSTIKTIISKMWSKSYNAIANCNKLIQEIESKDADFFPEGIMEKNLILGEALALRGFLHFDMARLFAPAPASGDDGEYIPYYNTFPSYSEPRLKTSEVLGKVIADLERAKDLVIQWDTTNYRMVSSVSGRFTRMSTPEGGNFFASRGNRLNFVAINGILARVCLYAGQTDKAKKYALYVYENFGPEGKNKWSSSAWFKFTATSNIGSSTASSNYVKLFDDVIFSLYDDLLLSHISTYKGTSVYMRLNMNMFDFGAYDDTDDARAKLIVKDGGNKEICQKWLDTGAGTSINIKCQYRMLPNLRMSEIYYILSECYYNEGNETEAERILNYVRNSRGAKRQVAGTTPSQFKTELIWEARKEFMTEGQTFFVYKRLNEDMKIGSQLIPMKDNFVFPLPDSETIF